MAKKETPTRRVIDITKDKPEERYSRQEIDPKERRISAEEVSQAGPSEHRNRVTPSGKKPTSSLPQPSKATVNKARTTGVTPKPISQKVTLATPGSKEARKLMGKEAAKSATRSIAQAAQEGETQTMRTHRAPKYVSNALSKEQTIRPSESQIAAAGPQDHDEKKGSYKRYLSGGRNNPMFKPGHVDEPSAGGTHAALKNKMAGAVSRFTAAHISGDRGAREAIRQEYHGHAEQLKAQSGGYGQSQTGICSTPNCTRTTEAGNRSCPGGNCNIDSPSVARRPRE